MGDFSVWEFSGNPVYYCSYDYFAANDVTAIHLVLFSLEEPYETQLSHITYWLNLLKALTLPQDNIGEHRLLNHGCVNTAGPETPEAPDSVSSKRP